MIKGRRFCNGFLAWFPDMMSVYFETIGIDLMLNIIYRFLFVGNCAMMTFYQKQKHHLNGRCVLILDTPYIHRSYG